MSKNLDRDFSLKDWVTKRAANAPDMQSNDRMVDILPAAITISSAIKAVDKEDYMRSVPNSETNEAPDSGEAKDTRSKIDSVSQITARISNVTATPAASPTQQIQIVRLLRDLGDRLRQSEKEREILWRELDGCRKLLTDIEDKANRAEKAYLSIEHKISKSEPDNKEESREFQKNVETKLSALETTAGSAILRLEDAVSENSKLSRRLDQITQDKVRIQRKMETLEETLTQTQDSLKAKALVLLTDAALANRTGLPQTPAYMPAVQAAVNAQSGDQSIPWWKQSAKSGIGMNVVTALVLITLGLATGWGLSQLKNADFQNLQQDLGLNWLNESAKTTEQAALPADQAQLMDDIASLANNIEPGDPAEAAAQTPQAEAAAENFAIAAPPVNPETAQALPSAVSNEDAEAMAVNAEKKAIDAFKDEKPDESLQDRISADRDLPAVITEIETKAFNGDAEAQHDLAAVYTAGHAGVKTDYDRALNWFMESAHNGIANAQYNLGVLYHQGLGVKQDTAKAISLYRVAASNNHPEAQYNLGIAHMEGVGADYNPQVASYYFERAAAGGVVEAAYNLGLIQENGLLGESQPDEAVFWYKLAADHGNKQAKQALDQMAKQLGMKDEDVKRIFGRIYAQRPDALKVVAASDKQALATAKTVQ